MWSADEKITGNRADRAVMNLGRTNGRRKESEKLSGAMAMILGIFMTLEIMMAAAMIFRYDYHGADIIALIFLFMVLYLGIVVFLTDK